MKILALMAVCIVSLAIFAAIDAKKKERMKKLVPQILGFKWIAGRNFRQKLSTHGLNVSCGLFYLTMSELEKEGIVESKRERDEDGYVCFFRIPQ